MSQCRPAFRTARLDLCWVSLVCCRSPGALFLPSLVRCFVFGRNGTSVTQQNRSVVSANFGLIDMSQIGFQNVPVLACEHTSSLSIELD